MLFAEEHTRTVELRHDELGNLGDGKLTFGGGQQVCAELSMHNSLPHSEAEYPLGVVRATDDKGKHYTLCGCVAYDFTIYADYLISGEVSELQFDRVDIRYSDISEWFLQWRRINGTIGEQLTWERLPQDIDASFQHGQRRFNLKTEYVSSLNKKGEDHILHEHIDFCLQPEDGCLSLDEVDEKARELACLLSILVSSPISLLDLHVRTSSKRFHRLYFPTFAPTKRTSSDARFLRDCFLQKHFLDGQWETILQNFFGSPHRKIRWTRVAGMQRYDGFWEYKAFGYVSLLDSYVSHQTARSKGPLTAPSAKKMRALETELKRPSLGLEQTTTDSVIAIVRKVFASRSEQNFSQKYESEITSSDADIVRIINISDDDFQFIKRIRDSIAHGSDIGATDRDYTRISVIVSRIELLLTYWAFADFGLSKETFLKALNNPFSRLRQSSKIDAKHLAWVTKTAEFFQVSPEAFREISSRKGTGVHTCFIEEPNQEIRLSEHFMGMFNKWQKARHSGISTFEEIFGVKNDAVRHVSHMYVECGDESLELHGSYIFDKSQVDHLHRDLK